MTRLIGMLRSPRRTLIGAIAEPRSLALAALVILIAASCSMAFLTTRVGRLAALDQEVRQLESFGTPVSEDRYANLRAWLPYRPLISATAIVVGWPLMWVVATALVRAMASRAAAAPAFAQVFTVMVHASSVLALRAVVCAPLNYFRESLGGATSLSVIVPGLRDGTFPARVLGAIDVFVVWWILLVALGLSMLYRARAMQVARWLFGAYAAAAAVLALTQALRGGL